MNFLEPEFLALRIELGYITTTYQSGSAGAPINGARTFDAANQIKTLSEVQGATTLKNLSYTFDLNGNRASRYDKILKTTTTYAYDQADRLIAAGDAQYTYNGDGLRMSKTIGRQPTQNFAWDIGIQAGLPLLLQDASSSYIYGPGGMLIEKIGPPPSGLGSDAPFWYHTDRVGSIRAITNSSGALVNTYSYDAYGKPLTQTGSLSNPFGYTGEYTDSETGFVYLRARYYDPESQQFLTVDPALAWTEEAYAYVGGSPTNRRDPLGLYYDKPGDYQKEQAKLRDSRVQAATSCAQALNSASDMLPNFLAPLCVLRIGGRCYSQSEAENLADDCARGGLFQPAECPKLNAFIDAFGSVNIEDLISDPKKYITEDMTPSEVDWLLGDKVPSNWKLEGLGPQSRQAGEGWLLREYSTKSGEATGRMIRWHPGGGHHGPSPYWTITDGTKVIRIGPQFP